MAARMTLSREQRLARKREAERLRYQRIKNDPEKYAQQKDKERKKYENKKDKGTIKTVKKMNPREHGKARKLWSQKAAKRRRRLALKISSNARITPSSDDEAPRPTFISLNENIDKRAEAAKQRSIRARKGLDNDANSDFEDMPGTSSQKVNRASRSGGKEIKVFCPNCNTEVAHTANGIQEDQKKIFVAKVYHYFEQEFEELKKMYRGVDLTPLSRFQQRTALATGVSESTVLQILKEEQGRNANKQQEPPTKRRRAPKRSRPTDSSSAEDSSDDSVDDSGQGSFAQLAQIEPEIETLVVKIEPTEYYKDQPQIDPIMVEVKAEPPDDDVSSTNETLALNEPAGTKRKGIKIPRTSDVTSTLQHSQGESSTAAAATTDRLAEALLESGLIEGPEIKLENIEIEEEGFS